MLGINDEIKDRLQYPSPSHVHPAVGAAGDDPRVARVPCGVVRWLNDQY